MASSKHDGSTNTTASTTGSLRSFRLYYRSGNCAVRWNALHFSTLRGSGHAQRGVLRLDFHGVHDRANQGTSYIGPNDPVRALIGEQQ